MRRLAGPWHRLATVWLSVPLVLVLLAALAATAAAEQVLVSAQNGSVISVFNIGAGGVLTPVPCNPVSNCDSPGGVQGIAIDPSGHYAYATQDIGNAVSVYAVGGSSVLTPVPCTAPFDCTTGNTPLGISVDPSGRYVYVGDNNSDSVSGFTVGTHGELTPIPCSPSSICDVDDPNGVAVDPSGRFLYSASYSLGNGSLGEWAIGAGGVLSQIACSPASSCETGEGSTGIVVDPVAPYLYVANAYSNTISSFSIGANGAVTPIPCSPASNCHAPDSPQTLAIGPSGRFLYAVNKVYEGVSIYAIGTNGALTPVSCTASDCGTGSTPESIAIDPSGRYLYVTNTGSNNISEFAIDADGTLTPLCDGMGSNCPAVNGPQLWSIAAVPDIGPAAAFTATAGPAGSATTFDAAGSTSPDYPVDSYSWSFGDGATLATSSPTASHAYARAGTYDVKLTVIDQAGCSTSEIYTGQTAFCDGSSKAVVSHAITAPAPAPVISALRVSPSRFSLAGRRVKGHCVASTHRNRRDRTCKRAVAIEITYELSAAAHVKLTIASKGKHPHVLGKITIASKAGTTRYRFDGRLGRHKLGPGKYSLTLSPAGGRGRTTTFAITG
jgi:DNA-binding beta-propeller fold protein YncE